MTRFHTALLSPRPNGRTMLGWRWLGIQLAVGPAGPDGSPLLVRALALHGVSPAFRASHFEAPLKPGCSVLTGGVSRR